jgi:glycosyltransferase involved in cell wall biosynthesis
VAPSNLGALSLPEPRYALVHDWLTVPGGSEDVFREVCALFDGTVFTSQWDPSRIKFVADREVRTSFVQRLPLALKKHYLYAPVLPHVYRSFGLEKYDVVLSDSHSFAHAVRKRPDALHVCYYHTPARSLWVPEVDDRATSGKLAGIKRRIAERLKVLDLNASRNPDVIFANSHTTASRIRKFYGREVDAVIYPPVDVAKWMDVRRESDSEGLLYWGRLIRYKRVDLAIEAAIRTGQKLQIVGSGPAETELKALAAGHPNVVFHGRLPDHELKRLMSRCRAFVFPAYEDFGIVAVEAMAAGLPVVAYGAGGASESVLPEFGVLFAEQTAESVAEAVSRLEGRTFDVEAMRRHAMKFDSARFRREYKEAVDAAVDRWRARA